jgi:hypothetical protein
MGRKGFSVVVVAVLCLAFRPANAKETKAADVPLRIVSPADGALLDSFLTAILRWQYPWRGSAPFPFLNINLKVSMHSDMSGPIVDIDLRDHQTAYRVALVPETTYYWQVTPVEVVDGKNRFYPAFSATAHFTTGRPTNDFKADDRVRYRNPREGAHWQYMSPVEFEAVEPVSPWYEVKAYRTTPPPRLDAIRQQLPMPVWENHPEALDAYWYCWGTMLRVWTYAPESADHQAVGNLIGIRTWGPWGSTMVWDTCFMLHFARYGAQAYPFITGLDNCYARQHENGFICRESDRDNREVYVVFPVNPPLFAWTEWEYYRIANDRERLNRILLPIVKHYEWWMRYQRRENGLYWVEGHNEADDSPRNTHMHYAVSATSYQGLAALYLSKIAREVGRGDLAAFFEVQHREIGNLVNVSFWDENHGIYNDLAEDRRFITELQPGAFCKHVHIFWPLMAGFVPPERQGRVVNELKNPASFNRRNGIASLSADSKGYNAENGQYWLGAVWPPTQCMVQEGLKAVGESELLFGLAEKYFNACIETYLNEKTIHENMAPDKPAGCGVSDFVGWGGIGPVANLIEYMLGLDIDAPRRTITWRIRRTEKHGLQNLQFGDFKVDVLCDARASASDPCRVTITSGGSFTLKVQLGNEVTERMIVSGTQQFEIGGKVVR